MIRAASALAVLLMFAAPARRAGAYDFVMGVRTTGQGYQLRRFGAGGGNELLNRRRFTQDLTLSVWDVTPDGWRGDRGDRNTLFVDVALRFDSDLGEYLLGRPRASDEIRELQQAQVDILQATLSGRRVAGRLDFDLGRQLHWDLVDFYAFDGARVMVHLPANLGVEVLGGTEVRGDLPLASPIYEQDGTSAGSRDPRTRPDQAAMLRPMAGAAVELEEVAGLRARLAYRRAWSATADRLPGEPASGVNDETVALAAEGRLGRRVYLAAGVRRNLLLAAFDEEQAALRVRLGASHTVMAEYAYQAPHFDGDSIWNVFATGASHDVRLGWQAAPRADWSMTARVFARLFPGPSDGWDAAALSAGRTGPGERAWGGSVGLRWRAGRALARGDAYLEDGTGGSKAGGDLSGRFTVKAARGPRASETRYGGGWDLEGRLTGARWRTDLRPDSNAGFSVGAQVGSRYQIAEAMRLHALVEDNAGTFYTSQWRALVVLDMEVAP